MTGAELRREFRLLPEDLLFRMVGSRVAGDAIEDEDIIYVEPDDHFLYVPRNIAVGSE
ncbi:MAG: hypothetical protein M3T56_11710 [Chloroflexota bacterium]|nr:hypothetical protein [Chloroflexota bacterium]